MHEHRNFKADSQGVVSIGTFEHRLLMELLHYVVKEPTQILQQKPEYDLDLPTTFLCTKLTFSESVTNILAKSFNKHQLL